MAKIILEIADGKPTMTFCGSTEDMLLLLALATVCFMSEVTGGRPFKWVSGAWVKTCVDLEKNKEYTRIDMSALGNMGGFN